MKKTLLFLFTFIYFNLVFAQKDTLQVMVYKGYSFDKERILKSPYRVFMSAGGVLGNPVMAFIDMATIKINKDSLKLENIFKRMSEKSIWLQIEGSEEIHNNKDYFWNQVDTYLIKDSK